MKALDLCCVAVHHSTLRARRDYHVGL